jgi:hypothetical protein
MRKTQFIAGFVSLVIAAMLGLAGFTRLDMTLNGSLPTNVHIYPAAFFVLLGVWLIFLGVKPLLRS